MLMMVSQTSMVSADAYHAFSVNPIYPSNQIEGSNGFFNLMMASKSQSKFSVEISNDGNTNMIAHALLFNAGTGDNASAQFNTETIISNQNHLTNIAELSQSDIEIKAGETKIVDITIEPLEHDFEGLMVGSIEVIADSINSDNNDKDAGLQVDNRIRYVVPIRLQYGNPSIQHDLKLLESKVDSTTSKNIFTTRLQNELPTHMGNISLSGTIKYNDLVIAKVSKSKGEILPYTSFNVVYSNEDVGKLKAGEYHVDLLVTGNNDEWHFTDTIVINDEEIKDINKNIKTELNPNLLYGLIVLMGILIFILLILLFRKKKKEEE